MLIQVSQLPANSKSRAQFLFSLLLIDRFHWLDPLAQVADSVFEWFFFLSFMLSSFQSNWMSYIQWFTWNDMMNDKELCKRVIKMKERKRKQSVLFDNENSTWETRTAACACMKEISQMKKGHSCFIYCIECNLRKRNTQTMILLSSSFFPLWNIFFDCTRFDITISIIQFNKKEPEIKIDFCDLSFTL